MARGNASAQVAGGAPARPLPVNAGPLPAPAGIGHNGGPQLYQGFTTWRWKKAHKQAWKTPPREIMLRRLKRAQELGMSYREYTLEILERGRYL